MDGPGAVDVQADVNGDGVLDNIHVAVDGPASINVQVRAASGTAATCHPRAPSVACAPRVTCASPPVELTRRRFDNAQVAETAVVAQNMYQQVPPVVPMAPPPMAPPPGSMPAPLPPGHPLLISLLGALDAEYIQGTEGAVGEWLSSVEEPATADLGAHGVAWDQFVAFVEAVKANLRSGASNVPALAAGWAPPQPPVMGQPPMAMAMPAAPSCKRKQTVQIKERTTRARAAKEQARAARRMHSAVNATPPESPAAPSTPGSP